MRGDNSRIAVQMATGSAAGYSGLRQMIRVLADSGVSFEKFAKDWPAEWGILSAGTGESGEGNAYAQLDALAIPASERRLHRESEHVYRVLAAAALAVCGACEEAGLRLVLTGVSHTDLPSLRGLIRIAEYQRAAGLDVVRFEPRGTGPGPASPPGTLDFRDERLRCLRLLDVDIADEDTGSSTETADTASEFSTREEQLYRQALDPQGSAADRLRAAVEFMQAGFASGNWWGVAHVATGCLPLCEGLDQAGADRVAASATPLPDQSFELEPALLRSSADLRAYLFKALGIQATFRDRQDEAVDYFHAMRSAGRPVSPELLAQSHLYAALTLTKRQHRLPAAVDEIAAGMESLAAVSADSASVRRERGWLHNLRGLTLARQHDLTGALHQEKAAWACLEDLHDPSSVHLRVNLISNISVLQERAGKYAQALRTWMRFSDSGFTADAKFVKHHNYRAGGLTLAAGHTDDVRELMQRSLECTVQLTDWFHECEIATELGGLALEQGRDAAAHEHFAQAAAVATRLGDPFRMARSRLGMALATGHAADRSIADTALRSRTNPERAEVLAKSVGTDTIADQRALLPLPRTKLNRPFDLVNF